MQWSLEDVYKKRVRGNIPPRDHLNVLGEAKVAVEYSKPGGAFMKGREGVHAEFEIDDNYFDTVLKRYIKMGTTSSIETRNLVQKKLEQANGNIGQNLDIYQSYVHSGSFDLREENISNSERSLLQVIEGSGSFKLGDFIGSNFKGATVFNKYFMPAWTSVPEAPVHGAPGDGELYLAFFCNGVKPDKGDLKVGSNDIELKGPGGRLLKTAALQNDFTNMFKSDYENDDEFIKGMAEFIANYAGSGHSAPGVHQVLSDNSNILEGIKFDYSYFQERKKLRPSSGKAGVNYFPYIGGIVQLYEYKKLQGFDTFMAFNSLGNDVYLQSINMRDVGSLPNFFTRISQLPTIFSFSRRRDGKGWALTISPK
jgi:hypothetical protein